MSINRRVFVSVEAHAFVSDGGNNADEVSLRAAKDDRKASKAAQKEQKTFTPDVGDNGTDQDGDFERDP